MEYLVVGGIAANVYGATCQTNDVDVVLRWINDNLNRAWRALDDLDAGLRIKGSKHHATRSANRLVSVMAVRPIA